MNPTRIFCCSKVRTGRIIFSDLLPYRTEKAVDFFYLPKPIIMVKRESDTKPAVLAEVRRQATQHKKQKKISCIRASRMKEFLAAIKTGSAFSEDNDFGCENLAQKVALRSGDSVPYYVKTFSFYDNCGLYLTVLLDDKKTVESLEQILKYVGLTGDAAAAMASL